MERSQIEELKRGLEDVQFLSPNEPLTKFGVQRVIYNIQTKIKQLQDVLWEKTLSITMWNPNISYSKGDIVVFFHEEDGDQTSVEQGKREFVFVLSSLQDGNREVPSFDIVDHVPVFQKPYWQLLNPLSYLLQNLNELRDVVKEVFADLLESHVQKEHGLVGSDDI